MQLADIFTIENESIKLDTSILIVPEFKLLWETYKDLDWFKVMYLLHNSRSPYANMYYDLRKNQVEQEFSNLDLTCPIFELACQKYELLNITPSTRYFNSIKSLIEKLTAYCESVEINDSKDGNLTHILRLLKESKSNLESYKAVENTYIEEQLSARGNAELGQDELNYDDENW